MTNNYSYIPSSCPQGDEPALSDSRMGRGEGFQKKKTPLNYALLLLKIRDRNSQEIRVKMEGKGFTAEEIETTLNFLTEKKFINDETFAKRFVQSQINQRPQGKSQVYAKLRRAHVSPEMAKEALETLNTNDEVSLAITAAAKWLTRKGGDLNQENKIKLSRYLAGRGFSWDITKAAIDKLEKGEDETL